VTATQTSAEARVAGLSGEWDCCFLDGRLVADPAAWERVVADGRLGDVEGAFALSWRDEEGALHLARDGVGERTLFYARDHDRFAHATTLRKVLDSNVVPRVLSLRGLAAYLSFGYVPGRETLVDGVFQLLPGEHLIFDGNQVRADRVWRLPAEDSPAQTEDEYRRALRSRLEDAVARRLPPRQVAATLSGGIDSSLVVALARNLHEHDVLTYSLSFGAGIPNELEFSSAVARHCSTKHRVLELSPRTVVERFDGTLAALSTPIGEPLTVANAVLFEAAAANADVVLNGEGGDPCFGGPKNVPMILQEIYGADRARAYLLAHRKCFGELERLLAPDVLAAAADAEVEELVAPHLDDARWSTLVNRLMALNVAFKGANHILAKVDHLSRAHAVLPRSPLFDRRVVDLAVRMPAELKLRGTTEKYILKRAVSDVLPPAIVERRKSGMRVPVETWLERRRFERFARERLLDGLGSYGVIRRAYLEELVGRKARRVPRRGVKIWLLLSLEAWLRTMRVSRAG
jgi:asparagine synthase (glutamine-hydrolysing)